MESDPVEGRAINGRKSKHLSPLDGRNAELFFLSGQSSKGYELGDGKEETGIGKTGFGYEKERWKKR